MVDELCKEHDCSGEGACLRSAPPYDCHVSIDEFPTIESCESDERYVSCAPRDFSNVKYDPVMRVNFCRLLSTSHKCSISKIDQLVL